MAWYKKWFDSPYYHLLYGERDGQEAGHLISNLLKVLAPPADSVFLDLACGKGRHALDLASYGYEVHGIDLSKRSISEADKHSSDRLHFHQHDMRLPFRQDYFDYILNLFTSFGYFEDRADNTRTLNGVYQDLKPGGVFVQDYFNQAYVRRQMLDYEEKEKGGIQFKIQKEVKDGQIIKTISFSVSGESHQFEEKVDLFTLDDFSQMYHACGLKLKQVFGDYDFSPFDPEHSPRLLLISAKL